MIIRDQRLVIFATHKHATSPRGSPNIGATDGTRASYEIARRNAHVPVGQYNCTTCMVAIRGRAVPHTPGRVCWGLAAALAIGFLNRADCPDRSPHTRARGTAPSGPRLGTVARLAWMLLARKCLSRSGLCSWSNVGRIGASCERRGGYGPMHSGATEESRNGIRKCETPLSDRREVYGKRALPYLPTLCQNITDRFGANPVTLSHFRVKRATLLSAYMAPLATIRTTRNQAWYSLLTAFNGLSSRCYRARSLDHQSALVIVRLNARLTRY